MPSNNIVDISQRLGLDISDEVGNSEESEIGSIMSDFEVALAKYIDGFNSNAFDNDGFIKRLQDLDTGNKADKDTLKNILRNVKTDFSDINSTNNTDMLLKRDIFNICTQMPEMRDVVYTVRDAIIESDAVTGNVSRTVSFKDSESESKTALVNDIENRFDLQLAIKNFCVPQTLIIGEMYINVVPYKRLFAELEAAREKRYDGGKNKSIRKNTGLMSESQHSIYNEANLKYLRESVTIDTKHEVESTYRVEKDQNLPNPDKVSDEYLSILLKSIDVCPDGSSIMINEMGPDGLKEILMTEKGVEDPDGRSFFEDIMLGDIDEDDVDYKRFEKVKGCYIKYLDPLKVIPIRLDRKVIGYYYVTTSMDLQSNPSQPAGIVDLSFQHYSKDRNLVASLSNIIVKSFDREMLNKNVKLKSEIADIIMEHRFNEGRLSFLYIPENEVVRLVVNEDENGKGHSIIEPSLFPARMYLLLTLYNMIYTLNNNTTRIHYLRSSGLNKDYAAQIQRAIRKFQSRRITIDDIYSYSGVLNKVGGMGEMVLPSGRGDYKALETDTLEAVNNPVNVEFLEQQRRQAISGTGVPALLVINAIDEVDFAKTLEMANTRFLSTVSSYKIDFNRGFTKLYQLILKYSTDLSDSEINSFAFKFNDVRQQLLDITNNMISNFNALYELVSQLYFLQDDLQTEDNKPSEKALALKRELAKKYLPQLDYDDLDKMIERVGVRATEMELRKRVADADPTKEEIDTMISQNITGGTGTIT